MEDRQRGDVESFGVALHGRFPKDLRSMHLGIAAARIGA